MGSGGLGIGIGIGALVGSRGTYEARRSDSCTLTGRTPLLGSSSNLVVNNTPSDAVVLVLTGFSATWWSTTPLPVELAVVGLPGCFLHVSPDLTNFAVSSGTSASFLMMVPSDPAFLGFTFYNQAVVLDPAAGNPLGASVTNAGMTVIGH